MEIHVPRVESSYLSGFLDTNSLRIRIQYVVDFLRKVDEKKPFDSIAFRGMSGALIAPAVALELEKSLIMVRKKTEGSHSSDMVEGDVNSKSYVIVDDFVCTGRTVYEIMKEVKKFNKKAKCIGIVESRYANSRMEYPTDLRQLEKFRIDTLIEEDKQKNDSTRKATA